MSSEEEKKGEEELREEIDSLKSKLDTMEGMLENIMNMHKNLLNNLSVQSDVEKRYIKMLSLFERYGKISPSAIKGVDDDISECIVEILLDSKGCNITQISERMREKRGSASRHTVRERLKKLEKNGVVMMSEDKNGKNYSLTKKALDEWAELLGIKI